MGAGNTRIEALNDEDSGGEVERRRVEALGVGCFVAVAGRGATGVVVRIGAFPGSDLPVVLKLLRRDLLHDRRAVERFRRELMVHRRLWKELQAPRLVPCLAVGEAGDVAGLYGVLPYYEMGSLEKAAADLPVAAALRCLADAAEGLGALHGHGYIHRDLCPGNIFVASEGGVPRGRLGDLGVAVPLAGNTLVRATVVERELGFSVGHLGYMDPWHGGAPTADLYGLGGSLHFVLTGSDPPRTPASWGLRLPHPDRCRRDVSRELYQEAQEVLARLSSEDVEERYASASEAAAAIQKLAMISSAGGRRPAGDGERRGFRWSVGALGMAGAIALGVLTLQGGGRESIAVQTSTPPAARARRTVAPVRQAPVVTDPVLERERTPATGAGLPGDEPTPAPPAATSAVRAAGALDEPPTNGPPSPVAPTATPTRPPDVPATVRTASRLMERRELEAAEALLHRALHAAPADPEASSLLALLLARRSGGLAEAARVLETSLEAHPRRGELRLQLARLLASGGDVDRALAILETAPAGSSHGDGISRWRVTLAQLGRRDQ